MTSTGTTGGAGTAKATSVALSGSPSSTAPVNQAYLFTPQLQATSSGFTFSIRNKPSWATFDISSGAIRGTPTIAQVGTYTDIVISATNGSVTAALPAFSIVVPSDAPSTNAVTLSWQPPAHNVDGTVMTNLAGYRIYHGPAEDQLSNSITVSSPGITSHTVSNLGAGTHFFGISAYNANGAESEILVIGSKRLM